MRHHASLPRYLLGDSQQVIHSMNAGYRPCCSLGGATFCPGVDFSLKFDIAADYANANAICLKLGVPLQSLFDPFPNI